MIRVAAWAAGADAEALPAAVHPERREHQAPHAQPRGLQALAEGRAQACKRPREILRRGDGLGEAAAHLGRRRRRAGRQRLGLGAEGLAQAARQQRAEAGRQGRRRQIEQVADAPQPEAAQQLAGLCRQAQGRRRQGRQGGVQAARRHQAAGDRIVIRTRGRAEAGERPGAAEGLRQGRAGSKAAGRQPGLQVGQQGPLAAEQVGAAGDVEPQAACPAELEAVGRGPGAHALAPDGEAGERRGVALRVVWRRLEIGRQGVGAGQRQAGRQARQGRGLVDGGQHAAPAVPRDEGQRPLRTGGRVNRPAGAHTLAPSPVPPVGREPRQPERNHPPHRPTPH